MLSKNGKDLGSWEGVENPQKKKGNFAPGNKANPGGRAHALRNKLRKGFLTQAVEAWEKYGDAALRDMAADHPAKFCEMFAGIAENIKPTDEGDSQSASAALAGSLSALFGRVAEAAAARSNPIIEGDVSRGPVLLAPIRMQQDGH